LHKGGDYLRQLKSESERLEEEIADHRAKASTLHSVLERLHKSMAGAHDDEESGVVGDSSQQFMRLWHAHVRTCTTINWKYWAFSLLMQPLAVSYQSSVETTSAEEMHRTALNWLDQQMSPAQLRPLAVKGLVEMARRSDVVTRGINGLPERSLSEACKTNNGGGGEMED